MVTVGKYLKNIKHLMEVSLTRELHKSTHFQKKNFCAFNSYTSDKIYLSEAEMKKIEDVDLSEFPGLNIERERFLVSYNFLLRFTESQELIQDDYFQQKGKWYVRVKRLKDSKHSIIPLKDSTLKILQKRNWNLKSDSNVGANRKLKKIGEKADITQMACESGHFAPKFNFITTHTARRSAATNLYLNNASLPIIADLGGWKSIKVLQTYLRASGMDSAQMAEGMDFFR